jgi:beta-catenin-like protein 1
MEPVKRASSEEVPKPSKRQRQELVSELEEQVDSVADLPNLDSRQLQILAINLQRRIAENIDLRLKYKDQPIKFLDSEEALHETIKLFGGIAADAERTEELMTCTVIERQAAKDLVMLLSHDNVDIACEVSKVLYELADESEQAASKLYELGCFEALQSNLRRMDEREDDEFQGVYYTLGVVEAIVEQGGFECRENEGEVLEWLLLKLQEAEFSTNQLYASEILSSMMLLPVVQGRAKRHYATERLLDSLQRLEDFDADSKDERELYENMMDSLALCLLDADSREVYREHQGFELILVLLK